MHICLGHTMNLNASILSIMGMGVLILVYALLAFGFIFCFVGKFPGQVLAYLGMIVAYFAMDVPFPTWLLIVCGVLVVASIVINKTVVPKLTKKVYEYGKGGSWGTAIGAIIALLSIAESSSDFVAAFMFIILPFLFAFVFELIATKSASEGVKRAVGAYVIYLVSILINVAICTICILEVMGGWA